mgnify:CR=1 FL=1
MQAGRPCLGVMVAVGYRRKIARSLGWMTVSKGLQGPRETYPDSQCEQESRIPSGQRESIIPVTSSLTEPNDRRRRLLDLEREPEEWAE